MPELAHHLRGGTLSDVEVETCRIEEDSPAVGKTLVQLAVRPKTGASIIAWTRGGVTESNPSEKIKLLGGDIIVLLGTRDQIRRAMGLVLEQRTRKASWFFIGFFQALRLKSDPSPPRR